MSKLNEITSTERLLEVIRKKNADSIAQVNRASDSGIRGKVYKFSSARSLFQLRKPVMIGVDIAPEYLRLVKIRRWTDNKQKLLQHRSVRLPFPLSLESREFADFLKSELTRFCGNAERLHIWTRGPANDLEIHHIRVPLVGRKQLENAVYWTMKKEASFDEQATLLDFKVLGEIVEQGVTKLHIMACTTSKKNVRAREALFAKIGFPLHGISAIPFAVLNLMRMQWPVSHDETCADLFIGTDFSRIDIYRQGNLLMGRDIKAGISSMVESLMDGYNQKYGGKSSMNQDLAREIIFARLADRPADQEPDIDITPEETFELILPAVERLVRQVERTFEYFTTTTGTGAIRKIYVSSTIFTCRRILEYIGGELGIESGLHDLPSSLFLPEEGLPGASGPVERNALVPALGLALSDDAHTPNFIFTHREKETASATAFLNRAILAVFLIAFSLCSGIFLFEGYLAHQKTKTIAALEKQLAGLRPMADQNAVLQLVAQVKQQHQQTGAYGKRYLGMAVISELSALTPRDINLIGMKTSLGKASPEGSKDSPAQGGKDITVEGLIFGKRESAEALLAGYMVKLDGSPLFRQLSLQKSSFESFKKAEVLHFIINAKIG